MLNVEMQYAIVSVGFQQRPYNMSPRSFSNQISIVKYLSSCKHVVQS